MGIPADPASPNLDVDSAPGSGSCATVHISLSQMARGARGTVCSISLGQAETESLGPMGLRERASIRVCRCGEPCIVEVGCAPGMCRRIGVSKQVAEQVIVAIEQ